jgi:hypothetical protein
MKLRTIASTLLAIGTIGCGGRSEKTAESKASTPPVASSPAPAAREPAVSAKAPATAPAAAPNTPAEPPKPKSYTLAAGTPIAVTTLSTITSKDATSGSQFEASLRSPLIVNGHTLAKTGAPVTGTIVNADQGGRVKGKASLTLTLSRIALANGHTVPIQTNSIVRQAKSGTKKNLTRTGIATGAGAAIGAIAGGGRGAAIGAGVGAGAGVATNVATRGPAAEVSAETVLNFSLKSPVTVTEKP